MFCTVHQKLRAGILMLVLSLGSAEFVFAEDLPAVITKGLTAYKETGADAAIQAWLIGSPMEGDKDALSQSSILHQIEGFYGKYTGFEVIKDVDITSSSRMHYIQLSFEKGPVFTFFLTYKKGEEWIVINFKFHTEPDSIFPSEVVFE